jgi:hypothetical protein
MKKLCLLLIVISFNFLLKAQELMKIKDVFNFDINDVFHYKDALDITSPPSGDRTKIIDKYYSEDKKTLFYKLSHDKYYSTIDFVNLTDGHPTVLYYFSKDTTLMSISSLDSSLVYYDDLFFQDTIIGTGYCSTLTNGYDYSVDQFEGDNFKREYGLGIGLTYDYHFVPSAPNAVVKNRSLTYYKRGGTECGTPDLTTSVINAIDRLDINLSPNPVLDYVLLNGLSLNSETKIEIININGELLDSKISRGNTEYKYLTNKLKQGVYIIKISNNKVSNSFRIIRK